MNQYIKHVLATVLTPALVAAASVMKDGGFSKQDWYAVGAAFIGGVVAYLTSPEKPSV